MAIEIPVGRLQSAERHPHCRRYTDRWCPADHHPADRLRNILVIAVNTVNFFVWKQTLIEHHDSIILPFNCFYSHLLFLHTGSGTRGPLPLQTRSRAYVPDTLYLAETEY